MNLERILGFRLVTRDAERLVRFYAALGFEADTPRAIGEAEMAVLGLGGRGMRRRLSRDRCWIDLDQYEHPGAAYPAGLNAAAIPFQHFALVARDVGALWASAATAGATPISRGGPVTLPASVGGATAIKFRDPDGHPLELIRLSADEADAGGISRIDHSALSVADLAASEAFYRAQGLARGDATLNHGATQEALDGLDGARVDVVPMLPATRAPHVELLHYRTPVGARASWGVADVVATRIVWAGDAPALLRDPDGHLHQIDR